MSFFNDDSDDDQRALVYLKLLGTVLGLFVTRDYNLKKKTRDSKGTVGRSRAKHEIKITTNRTILYKEQYI
jgi:hypothetical protein